MSSIYLVRHVLYNRSRLHFPCPYSSYTRYVLVLSTGQQSASLNNTHDAGNSCLSLLLKTIEPRNLSMINVTIRFFGKNTGFKKKKSNYLQQDTLVEENLFEPLKNVHQNDGNFLPSQSDVKTRMTTVLNNMEKSLRCIRGTDPTPELFDDITVQAYRATVPLSSVAQVVITSPRRVTITCFDPENAHAVGEAVRNMDGMNFNPVVEAGMVLVHIPRVSTETRKALVKQLGKMAENSRNKIRRIRRSAHDVVKKRKEGFLVSNISEDDAFRVGKEIDSVTDECIEALKDMLEKKKESVMDVWSD